MSRVLTPGRFSLAVVVAAWCWSLSWNTVGADEDPMVWLERMNRALAKTNYEGTFFHLRHGTVETFYIAHRVEGTEVSERLVSLDGNGREIIRSGGEQICYMPDQRRVLVQPIPKRRAGLLGAPIFCRNVGLHYSLEMLAPERISGRLTRVIAVNPRDDYRFGYRLWVDEQTALPLKTQLRSAEGEVIEQILFAKLTVPKRIPAAAVQPRVRSEGFQWIRQPSPPEEFQTPAWRAAELPPGFRLTDSHNLDSEGASPSAHLVYSDGLASVSVFIERTDSRNKEMKGLVRMGSSYAFSTMVQGHQVTAVGEVPMQTVRQIAASIRPDIGAAAGR